MKARVWREGIEVTPLSHSRPVRVFGLWYYAFPRRDGHVAGGAARSWRRAMELVHARISDEWRPS